MKNINSKIKINFLTKIFFVLALVSVFAWGNNRVKAAVCDGNIEGKSDAELQVILAECEKEISAQQSVLDGQKNKSKTLQNEITTLQKNIDAAKTKINQKNTVIKTIGNDIKSKNETINVLNTNINKGRESLAQLIRRTNEIDQVSFVNALLTAESISDFYVDVDTYSSLKKAVKESVEGIKYDKTKTEEVKRDLEIKQNEQIDAKEEIERQKTLVERNQTEQKTLLNISKNKEAEYQKILADRQAKAASVRSALFRLRGQGAIPFGDAYDYAKAASAKTGVSPAFILAVLKQESNLGANVGSCIITDLTSGQTKGVNSGTIFSNGIHPTRDLPVLQTILKDLGRNPLETRVSCPILGVPGYGGAMGPAQFIPSTWKMFATRIAAAMGKTLADPWNPADAIMANAIYMLDLGAAAQTYTAEREAACKYYSGRGCSAPGVTNAFYGNSVMNIKKEMQANIDIIEAAN